MSTIPEVKLRVIPVEKNKRTHIGVLAIFPPEGPPVGEVGPVNVRRPAAKATTYARLFAASPDLLAALEVQREDLRRIREYVASGNKESAMDIIGLALVAVERAIGAPWVVSWPTADPRCSECDLNPCVCKAQWDLERRREGK